MMKIILTFEWLIRRKRAPQVFQAWLQCPIMICGRRWQPLPWNYRENAVKLGKGGI